MSTLQTIASTDTLNPTSLGKINDNFSTLNTDKAEKSGGTFTGDIVVPDEAYGAGWDGSLEVPTKNAIYDKIQSMPALSDGDKGDIVVSGSGLTWTTKNDIISYAKMQNMTGDRILGRVSGVSGDIGELTGAQVNTLLPDATTSLGGRMSSADKTKLDGLSNEWTQVYSGSYSSGGTLDTSTLTTYDQYKIVITGVTIGSCSLRMRHNSNSTGIYSVNSHSTSGSGSNSTGNTELTLFTWAGGSGYRFVGEYLLDRQYGAMVGNATVPFDASNNSTYLRNGYSGLTSVTSIQITVASNIGGTVKVFGKNY